MLVVPTTLETLPTPVTCPVTKPVNPPWVVVANNVQLFRPFRAKPLATTR